MPAIFVIAVAARVPGLALPLIEWHGWRQTQTAYTALWFHQNGVDLLHAQLPIFGPPFEVPMELPLFQALASIVMDVGVAADLAMRLTGLSMFLLSALLLWLFLRRYASRVAALAALVAYLFVPLNLLFGKASLPEYLAIVGSLGWLLAGLRWREAGDRRWYILAFAAGTIGMLTKPTTPLFWTMPLVLATPPAEARGLANWIRARINTGLIALVVGPVAIAFLWTAYADHVKSQQLGAAFLASSSAFSHHFYYSDVAERLDPQIWKRNWDWISQLVVGAGLLPVALVGLWAAARGPRWTLWVGLALSALLAIAVFFGGYFKHDYYWIAVTPQAAAFVGLGVAWLWHRSRTVPLRGLFVVTLVLATVVTLQRGEATWRRAFPPLDDFESVLPMAKELARSSRSDDLVVVVGRGFDPDLFYYARRTGMMITAENASEALYRSLPQEPYRVFFSWDPRQDAIDVMTWWAWNGVSGLHTYEMGASPVALERSDILSTDDRAAFDAAAAQGRPIADSRLDVPCDGRGLTVPVDPAGSWLVADAPAGTRVSFNVLDGPLPIRRFFVLTPHSINGGTTVTATCFGPGVLRIERIVAAPPPQR